MSPVDLPPVPAPDEHAAAQAQQQRAGLPAGALGRWGAVLDQLAAVRARPGRTRRPRLVVLAAEHGIAELGVSAYEASATLRRMTALGSGAGPVAAVARAAGVGIVVEDLGVLRAEELSADAGLSPADDPSAADDTEDPFDRLRVGPSGSIDHTDALTDDEVTDAITRGRTVADREIDAGADLLIGATCGVGVTTPSAALLAALTGMEPVDATGRGSGVDDAAWIVKCGAVRDALFRVRRAAPHADVFTLLRVAGGADLAALTGLIAQAAVRRTPVLLHDLPSAVAAVLAHRLAPGADSCFVAVTAGSERGTRRALDLLGLRPLADWAGTGDSGLGALLTVPALWAAETLAYGEADADADPNADAATAAEPSGTAGPVGGADPDGIEQAIGTRSVAAIDAWDADLL